MGMPWTAMVVHRLVLCKTRGIPVVKVQIRSAQVKLVVPLRPVMLEAAVSRMVFAVRCLKAADYVSTDRLVVPACLIVPLAQTAQMAVSALCSHAADATYAYRQTGSAVTLNLALS